MSTASGTSRSMISSAASGDSDQIVLQARTGTLLRPAIEARVTTMLARVAALPRVDSVISPFGSAGSDQLAKGDTIGFATVNFDAQAQDLPNAAVDKVIDTAKSAATPQLQVELGGQAIKNAEPSTSSGSIGLGVLLALLVLYLAFGSLLAALAPIVTALIAIGIGYAITGLMTHLFGIVSFVPILGILLGLGVGVDYALFIITRYRREVRVGRSPEEAAVNAANTAGRAVFFAGLTVCIALLGQFALGVSFLYGLAIASSVTVALTMFAALTLLPAFLGFCGVHVLSRRERARLTATTPVCEEMTGGFWHRWAQGMERAPAIKAAAAFVVVAVVALPVLTLRLGLADAGSDPPSSTTRQAYDMLAKGFGPGFNGPPQLVTTLDKPPDTEAFRKVALAVDAQPGMVKVPAKSVIVAVSPDSKAATAVLYPATAPQAAQTSSLLYQLRDHVIPRAEAGTGLDVLVGGTTAGLLVIPARAQHHHRAGRRRAGRRDHHRRLHRPDGARALADALVGPSQLVASRLARPLAANPPHRQRAGSRA